MRTSLQEGGRVMAGYLAKCLSDCSLNTEDILSLRILYSSAGGRVSVPFSCFRFTLVQSQIVMLRPARGALWGAS